MQNRTFKTELQTIKNHSRPKQNAYTDLLLATLTAFLESNRICYAINEFSKKSCKGQKVKHIDLFIAQRDYKEMTNSLVSIFTNNKFTPIQKFYNGKTATQFVLTYQKPSKAKLDTIKVNVCSGYKLYGRLCFSSEELIQKRVFSASRDCWTLNFTYKFLLILINAIESKHIGKAQFTALCDCWENADSEIALFLKRHFNYDSIKILIKSLNSRNANDLNCNLKLFTKDSYIKETSSYKDLMLKNLNLLKVNLKPPGIVVGILGRDGSGKSTFVNEITKSLGGCFNNVTTFKRHPKVFYKELIFKKGEDYHFSKPHLYKERGYVASFLKLNLLLIEFLVGYWLKVFPFKRKADLVLYDRYFIDVLADPLRYRIKGNKVYIKLIHHILPQPDMWIILDLSTEVLMQRKQELTYEMSEKLRQEYLNLQTILPNCVVINNEDELQKTVSNATGHILNYMRRKLL